VFQKAIDRDSYTRQRDRLRERLALLEVELADVSGKEFDVGAVLAFAENVLTDAARLWEQAAPDNKRRLQLGFFPEGLTVDGSKFGTAVTCLAFTQLRETSRTGEGLASPTGFESIPASRILRSSQPGETMEDRLHVLDAPQIRVILSRRRNPQAGRCVRRTATTPA